MPGKRVGSIADPQIEASIHTHRTGKDLIMSGKRIVCVFITAAACFAVGSAAQEEGKPAANPADEAIRETARTFVTAFNKGDAKAVAALWAEQGQLVIDEEKKVLLGATVVGPNAGEVLGMLSLAVHEKTHIERLRNMIYAFPTFHGGIGEALGAYGRGTGKVVDPTYEASAYLD